MTSPHRQPVPSAPAFDYGSEAELYSLKSHGGRGRPPLGYKRFARAADAIQFAIEQLPPHLFFGTSLEVDDERYVAKEIRGLYESADYPLARRVADPAG
jgi:hypothetical protein